jgi:hypothetical protein
MQENQGLYCCGENEMLDVKNIEGILKDTRKQFLQMPKRLSEKARQSSILKPYIADIEAEVSCDSKESKNCHYMLESGINLIYIRDFWRHASITTTKIYLKTETELKRSGLKWNYPDVVTQNIPEWKENIELFQWLNDFCH